MDPVRAAEKSAARAKDADSEARRPLTPEELVKRRATVALWRERIAEQALDAAMAEGAPIYEMDARKCKGELREKIIAANDARLARISDELKARPLRASDRLLAALGITPGPEPEPEPADDDLEF